MNKVYKGVLGDLFASFGFSLAGILRLWVQLTSNFTTVQNILNSIFVILSLLISIRFIFIYKFCVRITDRDLIITEIIKNTKIPLHSITNTYEEGKRLYIYTKDNKRIRFDIKDLNADNREDFIHYLQSLCNKNNN